jgi:hypothetical protein
MPNIHGTVVDKNSHPVENATIALPTSGQFALSDERGFFEIADVPPGISRVNVVHRKFQKFSADLMFTNDTQLSIDLDYQY